MADMTIPLNPGENVVMDANAVYPKTSPIGFGYNSVLGHLWLTNQRLVFQGSLLGLVITLPLSRVTQAVPSERQIKTAGVNAGIGAIVSFSTLMLVEFDNGGREYFAVRDLAGWSEAINRVKLEAPAMEYTIMPSRRPGVEAGMGQLLVWFAGAVALLCVVFFCCSGLMVALPAILTLLEGGGQ